MTSDAYQRRGGLSKLHEDNDNEALGHSLVGEEADLVRSVTVPLAHGLAAMSLNRPQPNGGSLAAETHAFVGEAMIAGCHKAGEV